MDTVSSGPHNTLYVERAHIFVSILQKKTKDERVRALCQATFGRCWNNPFSPRATACPLNLCGSQTTCPTCLCVCIRSWVTWPVTLRVSGTHGEVFCGPPCRDQVRMVVCSVETDLAL